MCSNYRALEAYLSCERLIFDESRRVPIESMHPQKADWMLLGLGAQPPPGIKAWQVKEQHRKEQEDRIVRSNAEVGPSITAPRMSRATSAKAIEVSDKSPADNAGAKRSRAVGKGGATPNKRKTQEIDEEKDEEEEEEEDDDYDEVEEVEPPEVVVVSAAKGRKV